MIGKTLGHYHVTEKLGEGGMGVVYKARDMHLDRFVAVKVLAAQSVADPERKRRFVQEAKAASALSHPNIVTMYDIGTADGVDFIAMEFVAGSTLAQAIPEGGLPLATALDYGVQLADALASAHAAGIVHRDLKPANVMIAGGGRVKILDFGLAKLVSHTSHATQSVTVLGTVLGTVSYMSPEQASGCHVDGRSDIFSLGAVLYEMASGVRAFERDSAVSTLAAILHLDPSSLPAAPPDFAAIIFRCLRKDPRERFQRMDEVKRALQEVGHSALTPAIAVLPFENMSAEKDDQYFSDGLTEEIINALTKLPGLRVTARASAFAFHRSKQDIREVGATLGVDNVLQGSVRRVGSRVRVTAQLIKVSDACHLWSERYDREITDVFAIQDDIAQAIAGRLRVGIGKRETGKRPTRDMEAYNLFLQGRYFLNKWTPEGFAKARPCFEQAVARDPDFALAYDALAEFYWYLGFFGMMPPRDAFSTGIWAALRAVEIEDTLAETHALIAMYRKELDFNWPEVRREMERARELNPSSPVVRVRNVLSGLMPLGRLAEAVDEMRLVLETDPLSLFNRFWLLIMYYFAHDVARAREQSRFMLDLDPAYWIGHWGSGLVSMAPGTMGEAVSRFRKAVELSGDMPAMLGWLGMAHAQAGERTEAQALLSRLSKISEAAYVPPSCFAWIHLGLGDVPEALSWMDRAIEARDPMMMPVLSYPFLDPLRSDPRFRALLRKMNLEPYSPNMVSSS